MRACLGRSIQTPRRFCKATGANVAITFGLMLIPVMLAVGAAIDYSRAGAARAAMQNTADATALMAAKTWSALNAAQLQQTAATWFAANLNNATVANLQVAATSNPGASTVTIAATGSIGTTLLGVAGINQINLSVASTATQGVNKLQVALVLDNTGSMAEYGKISALRAATHQMLQRFQKAAQNPGDIQVAIVPFTTGVNVGQGNANANWLKWSYDGINGFSGSGTITTNPTGWTGCVTDRDQNFDTQNSAPIAGNTATLFPANNPWLGCPPQLMTLTSDWTALNNLADQMVPLGETNLTIGLVWGWQALTSTGPLNAPAPAPGTNQVIVFMTDGFNTANRWSNVLAGSGTTAQIDARTQLVCQNIKAAGITVYTVQVDTGGDSPPSTLLQNCASSLGNWFYLKAPGELVTTFDQIAKNLSHLRVAK
jgi:Flp pilus assembly protein TadG